MVVTELYGWLSRWAYSRHFQSKPTTTKQQSRAYNDEIGSNKKKPKKWSNKIKKNWAYNDLIPILGYAIWLC